MSVMTLAAVFYWSLGVLFGCNETQRLMNVCNLEMCAFNHFAINSQPEGSWAVQRHLCAPAVANQVLDIVSLHVGALDIVAYQRHQA